MAEKNAWRIERDSIGNREVPQNAYYGIQTLRAEGNFPITGLALHREFIGMPGGWNPALPMPSSVPVMKLRRESFITSLW